MKDGEKNPDNWGEVYSDQAGKYVSRTEYNAMREGRHLEYEAIWQRADEIRRKREAGSDGALDYYNLHLDLCRFVGLYCTDLAVLNAFQESGAAKLLTEHLESVCKSNPDKHGFTARDERHKKLVRYWFVRSAYERGYTGATKQALNNSQARAIALAAMIDQDLPAGKGRHGKPLTDGALKDSVEEVEAWRKSQYELKKKIRRAQRAGDHKKKLELLGQLDEDELPDWAITDSEREGIRKLATVGYIAELQEKFPDLPRLE
jgi:hypothetical protein